MIRFTLIQSPNFPREMIQINPKNLAIGVERNDRLIKCALVQKKYQGPILQEVFSIDLSEEGNVKPLYIHHPIITTAVDAKTVLVRVMNLPLTKEKDIVAALPFQAEPILPYPIEEAILSYQVLEKEEDSTLVALLSVRKEMISKHVEEWQEFQVEPEQISSIPLALSRFAETYLPFEKKYLVLHLNNNSSTCILTHAGKLLASFSQQEGLNLLKNEATYEEGLGRLQRSVIKMSYALAKESGGAPLEGIVVTGEAAEKEGLSQSLIKLTSYPLLTSEDETYSSVELLSYAVPIGLALGSFGGKRGHADFRQNELSYPHPWKRFMDQLILYFSAVCLLTLGFYFFSHHYLKFKEDQVKEEYVDLLAGMGKSHKEFEMAFQAKNPEAKETFGGKAPPVADLSIVEISERIGFLRRELQAIPDTFPLFANVPRVSDVLAWLSQHHAVDYEDEKGERQARLQIENFTYTLVKRPQQGKKNDPYQVKIDLEFSSPNSTWAREFHDALIAPNPLVDSKGEVKWNSNRGRYKTSFFLKDKTIYPGGV